MSHEGRCKLTDMNESPDEHDSSEMRRSEGPADPGRRRVVGWLAAASAAARAGHVRAAEACLASPDETRGPFPADGSRSMEGGVVNVLAQPGIVRSDLTRSFGAAGATAPGLPLTLTVVMHSRSCAPLLGFALYVWHCDREGRYSLYSKGISRENYLRGVQVGDAAGQVTFKTIFPACYMGRYPHIHAELYSSLSAIGRGKPILTTQLAMPKEVCDTVYRHAPGYAGSLENLADLSASGDMVFQQSTPAELAAQTPVLTGDIERGYGGIVRIGV
jgi:protocatechuate 3,4-dioxygenase beta subunit